MSTKLNAEGLARERYPENHGEPEILVQFQEGCRFGYFWAIEEVAQPIADERDELRALIERAMDVLPGTIRWGVAAGKERFMWTEEEAAHAFSDESNLTESMSAILAKYPKP
jgi:hypothetical protein